MNCFTTYFANVKNLPKDVVPISICGRAPEWWTGLQYRKLAPRLWFFLEWKQNHDNEFYVRNFNVEVLDKLNPDEVWNRLLEKSEGRPFALVCYEKLGDFCHRHLVSKWLRKHGYNINEWTTHQQDCEWLKTTLGINLRYDTPVGYGHGVLERKGLKYVLNFYYFSCAEHPWELDVEGVSEGSAGFVWPNDEVRRGDSPQELYEQLINKIDQETKKQ